MIRALVVGFTGLALMGAGALLVLADPSGPGADALWAAGVGLALGGAGLAVWAVAL